MNEKKKTILVTGGAGFIGSHLCERLQNQGHRVISLDNYFAGSPENHITDVEYIEGHTKDIDELVSIKPDIVFHLGEYSRVEKSFEDIEDVWDLNKTGTFAVLEFCRMHGSKLVYAGSSTKFADEGKDQSPYAWVKATNTELVKNYGVWYGLDYAITYFYNVFGGRERGVGPYATLIGIYKEEYRRGNPLTVVLPGTQKRNFTHVDDIVDGLVLVGERGNGDGYGIGNDVAFSVKEVAGMFDVPLVMLPERVGNRMNSSVDSMKTRELGWKPKRNLVDDIKKFLQTAQRELEHEQRILVFSTTFVPLMGPAENALENLTKQMPGVQFDIVTPRFSKSNEIVTKHSDNVTIYRVGSGSVIDKYLLPYLGRRKAIELARLHSYMFSWGLLASYAALAGIFSKKKVGVPFLLTLADQKLSGVAWYLRKIFQYIMRNADQVYVTSKLQESHAKMTLGINFRYSTTIGKGDAFANQIRFVYSSLLRKGSVKVR
jgi:UDP-glucose 4-epimerase